MVARKIAQKKLVNKKRQVQAIKHPDNSSSLSKNVKDVASGRALAEGMRVMGKGMMKMASRIVNPPLTPMQEKQMKSFEEDKKKRSRQYLR